MVVSVRCSKCGGTHGGGTLGEAERGFFSLALKSYRPTCLDDRACRDRRDRARTIGREMKLADRWYADRRSGYGDEILPDEEKAA